MMYHNIMMMKLLNVLNRYFVNTGSPVVAMGPLNMKIRNVVKAGVVAVSDSGKIHNIIATFKKLNGYSIVA